MRADLHVHSNYSDGSDSIHSILIQAVQNGITHMSIVDHDTVAGQMEALQLGKQYGMEIIPGIEISAFDFKRNRKVHILGYHYELEAPNIRKLCDPLLNRRHIHSLWQLKRIEKAGYGINREAVLQTAQPGGTVYKQHIMTHLTEADYTSPLYRNLYQSLFKGMGPAAGDIVYADAFEAVEAIAADGGLAVIAHPGQLNSYEIIPELVEAGLSGVERNHPDHTAADHERIDALCDKFQLFKTGGSDYHGKYGSTAAIGAYTSHDNSVNQAYRFC